MNTKNVIVMPYDDSWAKEFEKIQAELTIAVGDCVIAIEHVGSTSVKGLSAKPIIDIDIVIQSRDCFQTVAEKLASIGYHHEGDLGIQGREAFKYSNKPHLMRHHLYVCAQGAEELRRHITFRDYLRANKRAVDVYSRVKEQAAKLYPKDIDGYMAYKNACIETLYKECGLQ